MKLFNKPFGEYVQFAKAGIGLLLFVSVVRYLMKPAFNIPYEQGTTYTSVTILLFILMAVYAVKVARQGGSYRDLLGVAAALSLSATAMIIVAIMLDDFGGFDSYYTDPAHGGSLSPWAHMGGHVVFGGIVSPLVLWGLGSLVYLVVSRSRKKAIA